MDALPSRLDAWGRERGWRFGLDYAEDVNGGSIAASLGPVTGYGKTTNEAVNALADGLVDHGWHGPEPLWRNENLTALG